MKRFGLAVECVLGIFFHQ